jgi:hypothetical protein
MKKIIRLTESDLTRIVRRVLMETKEDETNYHRYQEGGDPGIEPFLGDPLNERMADELQHQLENDKYAKGPEMLRNTNIGKGTGKLFIFFNGQKMTTAQFIDQVQEDASEGYCHTINDYMYDNKFLGATRITIKTTTGKCAKAGSSTTGGSKTTTTKACKHSTKQVVVDDVRSFQSACIRKGLYYAEYTDGTTKKCSKVDGLVGCCTATCYAKMK